jgi:hypothetical protein
VAQKRVIRIVLSGYDPDLLEAFGNCGRDFQGEVVVDVDHVAGPKTTRRSPEALPLTSGQAPQQQQLGTPAASEPTADARRQDPRAVRDQEIAWLEQLGQIPDMTVAELTVATIEDQ